jgi:hypothetical protein
MDAFELVEMIRKKPDRYLHGGKSLKQLHAIMIGYDLGAERGIFSDFRPFNRWLAQKFELPEPSGWYNMITTRAGSDGEAFDLFFELLDSFRSESRSPSTG